METQAPTTNVVLPQTPPTNGNQTEKPDLENKETQGLEQEKELLSPVEQLKREREGKDKDLTMDSRFAALTRQQKRLLDEKNKFKSEYEQQKAEIEDAKKFKESRELAKTDPRKALELLGLSYEDITNAMLIDPPREKDPEVMTLKQKLEELEKENKEAKTKAEQDKLDSILAGFKKDIREAVKDADKFEFINLVGDEAIEQIYNVCEEYYNETIDQETGLGQHLELDKAADYVENYLEKQFSKLKTSKKLGFASAPVGEQKTHPQKQFSQTLTNQIDGSSSQVETLNPEERMRKIALKYSQKQ